MFIDFFLGRRVPIVLKPFLPDINMEAVDDQVQIVNVVLNILISGVCIIVILPFMVCVTFTWAIAKIYVDMESFFNSAISISAIWVAILLLYWSISHFLRHVVMSLLENKSRRVLDSVRIICVAQRSGQDEIILDPRSENVLALRVDSTSSEAHNAMWGFKMEEGYQITADKLPVQRGNVNGKNFNAFLFSIEYCSATTHERLCFRSLETGTPITVIECNPLKGGLKTFIKGMWSPEKDINCTGTAVASRWHIWYGRDGSMKQSRGARTEFLLIRIGGENSNQFWLQNTHYNSYLRVVQPEGDREALVVAVSQSSEASIFSFLDSE